jgi:thioredoxin-related protein
MNWIIYFLLLVSFNLQATLVIDKFTGLSVSSSLEENYDISKLTKPLVLIFISKDCPCSKGNLSYINELSKNYPDFKFVGIHSKKGSTLDQVKNYLSDKNVNFDVLVDSNLSITSKFGALKTPHAFIVNLSGAVVYNGGVSNSTFPVNAKEFFLKNALEDIKNQRPVAKNQAKTLGCFIVR